MYSGHSRLGPHVIASAVPFHYVDGELLVALVSHRADDTESWRLPSTTVTSPQTSLQALEHTLTSRYGLSLDTVRYREQLYTFEASSHAGSMLCISYIYLSHELVWRPSAEHIGLFPVSKLPTLPDSDRVILDYALDRLKAKAVYTTLPAFLLPPKFDLGAYQRVFETLSHTTVDRRNFRKKLRALDVIKPIATASTNKKSAASAPELYRLRSRQLTVLPKPFA